MRSASLPIDRIRNSTPCAIYKNPAGFGRLAAGLAGQPGRGAAAVAAVINGARSYPVRGLYRLSEYPQEPALQTFSVGWGPPMDRCMRLFPGEFLVVTGIDPARGERYLREAADFRKTLVSAMERAAIVAELNHHVRNAIFPLCLAVQRSGDGDAQHGLVRRHVALARME